MIKHNQNGFSAVEAILVVAVIGIIGGVGYFVYSSQRETNNVIDTADMSNRSTPTVSSDTKVPAPAGYKTLELQDYSIRFNYPTAYGEFVKTMPQEGVNILESETPTTAYGPGISGQFHVYIRDAKSSITSRKYGPSIKLQNGKWIVTETNPSDVSENKLGEEYTDFEKKTVAVQKNGNLDVYTLKSADEGSEIDTLTFVVKDKLIQIQLPTFIDGTYAGEASQANDKASFNTLLQNVRKSISTL